MQPHQAHVDHNLASITPLSPIEYPDAYPLATTPATPRQRPVVKRIRGYSDPNSYGAQGPGYDERAAAAEDPDYYRRVYEKRTQRRESRFAVPNYSTPYIVDDSDDDDEPPTHHRRPERPHRRPPVAYERYGPVPGRTSLDAHPTSRFSEDDSPSSTRQYKLYPPSSRNTTPHRLLYAAAAANTSTGHNPPTAPGPKEVLRLPWTLWMNSRLKNHFVAFIGEFVGTTMFLFFAFSGTQVANIGSSATNSSPNTTTGQATGFSPTVLLYIAVVFGFSLMVNVWVFFRISGGLFNPAVTLAMVLCRGIGVARAVVLLVAQLAGSVFSSFIVSVLFPTQFNVRTTLSEGTSLVRGVFVEAVLTAELVFTVLMLAKEKHKGTWVA